MSEDFTLLDMPELAEKKYCTPTTIDIIVEQEPNDRETEREVVNPKDGYYEGRKNNTMLE